MTDPERIQLAPVRASFRTVGWVSGLAHAVGFLIALSATEPKSLTLIFFGIFTLFGAALSFAGHRHALRTVRAAPPVGGVIVPARFPARSIMIRVGLTVFIVALSVVGNLSASVLGVGLGSSFASLWGARKIAEFERDDGRRVVRKVGRVGSGDVILYASP